MHTLDDIRHSNSMQQTVAPKGLMHNSQPVIGQTALQQPGQRSQHAHSAFYSPTQQSTKHPFNPSMLASDADQSLQYPVNSSTRGTQQSARCPFNPSQIPSEAHRQPMGETVDAAVLHGIHEQQQHPDQATLPPHVQQWLGALLPATQSSAQVEGQVELTASMAQDTGPRLADPDHALRKEVTQLKAELQSMHRQFASAQVGWPLLCCLCWPGPQPATNPFTLCKKQTLLS